jgi:hypothetical protein
MHLLLAQIAPLLPRLSRASVNAFFDKVVVTKAISHLSCRPPKKLKPPEAFCSDVSACCSTSISVVRFVAEFERVPHLTKQRSWITSHVCVYVVLLSVEYVSCMFKTSEQ